MGGTALDDGFGIAVFGRRHETEMTRRESQFRIGGQGAETGETRQMPSHRGREQCAVAFARNSVENHPGKRHRGLMIGEPA